LTKRPDAQRRFAPRRGRKQPFSEASYMEKRIHIHLLSALVLGAILASAALAQNEQWLQYRSANEARQMIGDIGYQLLHPSATKPEGIKLPALKSDQPLFLDWKTLMVASGKIWMIFDKSNPKGEYDRLYLDANANGDLSDDPVYQPYRRESSMSFFGPAKVTFESPDGPITYHLSMELRADGRQSYCLLSPACWYEGQITVGGVKKRCLLIDHNVNGTFNDKSRDYNQSDRIRLGEQSGYEGGAVGDYVEVDNRLYKADIARDGACLTLTEAKDVPCGTVRLADNITTVIASGENGSFIRKPENGVIKLPVGEYRVDSWTIARKDEAGARWEMKGMLPSGGSAGFTAAPDKEVSLPFGEPIYSTVQASKNGSIYAFEQKLQGRQGERVVLTRNGSQPPPPKLHIRNRDGTYDRSISSEYG
jgi:hypothetical protein